MASLLIAPGDSGERLFPLGSHQLVSVGRDDQCTLQILDDQVSRRHLQIRLEADDDRHCAADYRSANGVFVNDDRISCDVALMDGDRIRIGRTTIVYLIDDHADVAEAREALRKRDEWKRSTIVNR